MKRIVIVAVLCGMAGFLASCASTQKGQGQSASENDQEVAISGHDWAANKWPIRFTDENGTAFTVFEPDIDAWDGHQLSARSAMAVQNLHEPTAIYGVVDFSAITLVNKSAHTARLANFKVTHADFPSAAVRAQEYEASLKKHFQKHPATLALRRLETSLAIPQPPRDDHLDNMPPRIIIATRPAVLVSVDGPPAWRPVAGSDLERAINTRWLVLRDPAGMYYVRLFDGYLQAAALGGPWTVARRAPKGAARAEKEVVASGQADLMVGTRDPLTHKMPSLKTAPAPDVFLATSPSELIQFRGAPEYASIPGTELLYAVNTSGNLFKSLQDQKDYVLISGRWYRSESLKGPWRFVPGADLPRDFAAIPDNSPKENIKASVPGTSQAQEALIANSIPQGTAVPRTRRMSAPQFDGGIRLAAIKGTPLHFVVNCSTPIIEVGPQSWYACQDGVWYMSSSANGPWMVADSVPPVIYTIPANSPLYYVTYVQVYGATPEVVYEGYTPGYMGAEEAEDGTVVYGTGYDYDPWIGDEWYGPPVTWGWGYDVCWTPWWGWGFNCGFGWGWGGCFPPHPYWSGYRGWYPGGGWRGIGRGDWAGAGGDLYYHGGSLAGGPREAFGQAYNSRTGWLQAGQQSRFLNVAGARWDGGPKAASMGNLSSRSYGGAFHSYGGFPNGGWHGGGFHDGGGGFHGGGGGFRGGGGGGHGGGGGGRR